MTLFKKKNIKPALYFSLNRRLEQARANNEPSFYYPLKDYEVDKAMAWGVHNKIGIKPDHITDNIIYYKFFGYILDN